MPPLAPNQIAYFICIWSFHEILVFPFVTQMLAKFISVMMLLYILLKDSLGFLFSHNSKMAWWLHVLCWFYCNSIGTHLKWSDLQVFTLCCHLNAQCANRSCQAKEGKSCGLRLEVNLGSFIMNDMATPPTAREASTTWETIKMPKWKQIER